MDRIRIKDLLLRCVVGINDWERKEKQDVLINVELFVDLKKASSKDDISLTLDYKKLKKEIVEYVEKSSPYLIEKIAGDVALICINYEQVRKVVVEVDKPYALRFARSVSVVLEREKSEVYIGLGSNIEPEKNLENALKLLSSFKEIKIKKVSSFYITPSINEWGEEMRNLPYFLNGAIKVQTYFTFDEMSEVLKDIEVKLGRIRSGKSFDPRPIDIDILIWKDSEGVVKFLHKDLLERNFVSSCVFELEPNLLLGEKHILEIVENPKIKVEMKKAENLEFLKRFESV